MPLFQDKDTMLVQLRSLSWLPSGDLEPTHEAALISYLGTPSGEVVLNTTDLDRYLQSRGDTGALVSYQKGKISWIRAAVEYLDTLPEVTSFVVVLDNLSSQDPTIREGCFSMSRYGSYHYPIHVQTTLTKESNLDYAHHCYLALHLGNLEPRTLEQRVEEFPYGKGSVVVLHIKHQGTNQTPWGRIHRSVLVELLTDPDAQGTLRYRTLPIICTVEESVQDFAQLPLTNRFLFLDTVAFGSDLQSYSGTLNLMECGVDLSMHFEPFLITGLDGFHMDTTLVTTNEGLTRMPLTDVEKTHWILRQRCIDFDEERFLQDYGTDSDLPWDLYGCKPTPDLFLSLVREAEEYHIADLSSSRYTQDTTAFGLPTAVDKDGFDVY